MALVKCKECEKEVSTQAEKCPNCGAPIKKKGMGCFSFIVLFIGFIVIWSVLNTGNKTTFSSKLQKKTSQNKPEISTSDFEILSFNPKWEYDRLKAIGEIKNNGKIAAGPEVEVIARDKNGKLVASKTFWPNSINNIPPGGTCGIAHPITEDSSATKAEIKVIRVSIWD